MFHVVMLVSLPLHSTAQHDTVLYYTALHGAVLTDTNVGPDLDEHGAVRQAIMLKHRQQ